MKKYLAVDIGGSRLFVGLVDEIGNIFSASCENYDNGYNQESLLSDIKKLTAELDLSDVVCGGVTIPGLADSENGLWLSAPFTDIKSWDIAGELEKLFNFKFYVENDVNACALAERKFGICKKIDDFMWITLSNGVGGAVFIDGKLFKGRNSFSGEIGHIVIDENGKKCACGNIGCLEAVASIGAVVDAYKELSGFEESLETIADLALNGDENANAVYKKVGISLGKALSFAANLLNTDTFIFGGGVAASGIDFFAEDAKREAMKHVLKTATPKITVRYTGLGYYASLKGAAAVAMLRQ